MLSSGYDLESRIKYAEFHLKRAIHAEKVARSRGEDYPDDYLRLSEWLNDAYQKREVLAEKQRLEELLEGQLELDPFLQERIKAFPEWKEILEKHYRGLF